MPRLGLSGLESETRLSWLLGAMFLGLALPAALLVREGFARLELEEFRRQQLVAEGVARRIDSALAAAIAVENARPVSDFEFSAPAAAGEPALLSPLSSIAAAGAFPGAIGYFQVDAAGQLSTPLLPESDRERERVRLGESEMQFKVDVERRVAEVLEANRLVVNAPMRSPEADADGGRSAAPLTEPLGFADETAPGVELRGQLAFDQLAETPTSAARLDAFGARQAVASAEADSESAAAAADSRAETAPTSVRVSSFAGEIEPLRFSPLATGQLVLFRNAWRDGQRYVQGLLIDRETLIQEAFAEPFAQAGFPEGARLRVSVAGEAVSTLGAAEREDVADASLHTARLSPPLSDIALYFTAGRLDRGPGFGLLVFTATVLAAVLVAGFASIYLFGMQQLRLAREQRNFVSAVSHELKTPLTSIRMYGEMLKSGWADDEKKKIYYDFIVDEGERLSRLIENVLQLARVGNGKAAVATETMSIGQLFDQLRSKLATQAERAGFALELDVPASVAGLGIAVDADALIQVFINLVDNSVKFSSRAEQRVVVLAARRHDSSHVLFTVRDFGPGIPPTSLKRLFELFYRPDNELTRTTAGTGIGLALVKQLVTAMGGRVDVKNCEPGAEFRLSFPLREVPATKTGQTLFLAKKKGSDPS